MEKEQLASWDGFMVLGSEIFLGIGVLIFLYHEVRVLSIRDYKEKYDYVSTHEVRYLWYTFLALIVAGYTCDGASSALSSRNTRLFACKYMIAAERRPPSIMT